MRSENSFFLFFFTPDARKKVSENVRSANKEQKFHQICCGLMVPEGFQARVAANTNCYSRVPAVTSIGTV